MSMKKPLILAWSISLLSIPLLSLYGRPIQVSLMAQVETEMLNILLSVIFSGLFLLFLLVLWRFGTNRYVFNLLWVGPVFMCLYGSLPFVEKIHIALFGLFGFISHKILGLRASVVIGFSIACLDELLQHYLASRVGDWRDVRLNLFSVFLGIFLAVLLHSPKGSRVSTIHSRES